MIDSEVLGSDETWHLAVMVMRQNMKGDARQMSQSYSLDGRPLDRDAVVLS